MSLLSKRSTCYTPPYTRLYLRPVRTNLCALSVPQPQQADSIKECFRNGRFRLHDSNAQGIYIISVGSFFVFCTNTEYILSLTVRSSLQVALSQMLRDAVLVTAVRISSLDIEKLYRVLHAKRLETKYGTSVLTIRESYDNVTKVFLSLR